jgi:hypothetical protein
MQVPQSQPSQPLTSSATETSSRAFVLLISWHILVQIIWHTRSFLAVPADPGKRLKLHIASEYAFPQAFSHPIRNWCAK